MTYFTKPCVNGTVRFDATKGKCSVRIKCDVSPRPRRDHYGSGFRRRMIWLSPDAPNGPEPVFIPVLVYLLLGELLINQ